MDLQHRFSVPTDVESTWAHFGDIAALAACFPGAQVTSTTEDSFSGSVKVKLGPIALVYKGSGTFTEKDDAAHSFRVDAKGKDKRGNGTAGAKVSLSMSESTTGGTDVEVITDLAITGKPAQFGRGVMQDVSDKLLGQFVACLEQRLTDPGPADVETPAELGEVEQPNVETPIASAAAAASAATPGPASPAPRPRVAPRAAAPAQDDALDLGAAVLPILAKTYWKPAAAGLVVVLLLLRWRRRR